MSEISLNLFYKTQDGGVPVGVGTKLSLRHAWAASMFVSVHLHTCSCISLDLPEGGPSLPVHHHPSLRLTGSVLLATCFPDTQWSLKCNGTALLSSTALDWGRDGGGQGQSVKLLRGIRKSCWASLGNDCVPGPGPAALNSGSSPGGGTVSGFSLRC